MSYLSIKCNRTGWTVIKNDKTKKHSDGQRERLDKITVSEEEKINAVGVNC